MNAPVISCENITKIYPLYETPFDRVKEALHPLGKAYHSPFHAVRDVSLQIRRGETVGIIGRNGSGKSTLLKIITGILQPTTGHIHVDGKVSALLELGAGFNPNMTGRENVFLNGTLMGFPRSDIERKMDEIIDFADIGEFLDQPVKTYSSGMFVRLAFAVATAVEPDVLIVDEALSVGDMFFQAKCMKKMKSLMEQNCTTLFVSHDLSSVKGLCQRAVFLEDGSIVREGEAGEICDYYAEYQIRSRGLFDKKRSQHSTNALTPPAGLKSIPSDRLDDFRKRVKDHRKGSGRAEIHFVELLSESATPVVEADYADMLSLRVYFEAFEELSELVVAFYIKDKNQRELLGTNNVYESTPIEIVEQNQVYSVEFSIPNYFCEGNYSIQVLLADSLAGEEFLDWVDNAWVFKSNDAPNRTRWSIFNPPIDCRVECESAES